MVTCLLILARAFHYASGMVLVSVVAFRWLILLPAFVGEADGAWEQFRPLFLRLNRIFVGSGVILVVSGLALFWAVSAGMSDTSLRGSLTVETLGTVLLQTQFGSVFQWRFGFMAILGIFIWRLASTQWLEGRTRSGMEIATGLVTTALLVSFAWTGHAASTGGADFWWRVIADAMHLFAGAIWPTGLLPFVLFLAQARGIEKVPFPDPVLRVVRYFSFLSLIIVGVLTVTGIINSYFLVGSFQALFSTTYGQVLCVKLILFGLMLGVASVNRFRILPRLFAAQDGKEKVVTILLLNRLRGFVLAELSLAVALILVVSLLGTVAPPR